MLEEKHTCNFTHSCARTSCRDAELEKIAVALSSFSGLRDIAQNFVHLFAVISSA